MCRLSFSREGPTCWAGQSGAGGGNHTKVGKKCGKPPLRPGWGLAPASPPSLPHPPRAGPILRLQPRPQLRCTPGQVATSMYGQLLRGGAGHLLTPPQGGEWPLHPGSPFARPLAGRCQPRLRLLLFRRTGNPTTFPKTQLVKGYSPPQPPKGDRGPPRPAVGIPEGRRGRALPGQPVAQQRQEVRDVRSRVSARGARPPLGRLAPPRRLCARSLGLAAANRTLRRLGAGRLPPLHPSDSCGENGEWERARGMG